MNMDEHLFDFLAAAEDTGRQLDDLVKAIPGEIRGTLSAEYQKSPWVTALPATAERVTAAAERAESAARVLTKKTVFAGFVVCLAAVVVPLLTWGYAYWQTSKLREEQAALMDKTGGGVLVEKDDSGKRYVRLPFGAEIDQKGFYEDGRFGFVYTWPPVR